MTNVTTTATEIPTAEIVREGSYWFGEISGTAAEIDALGMTQGDERVIRITRADETTAEVTATVGEIKQVKNLLTGEVKVRVIFPLSLDQAQPPSKPQTAPRKPAAKATRGRKCIRHRGGSRTYAHPDTGTFERRCDNCGHRGHFRGSHCPRCHQSTAT